MSIELPSAFLNNMKAQLGKSYDDFIASYEKPPFKAMLCRFGLNVQDRQAVPWASGAYYILDEEKLGSDPLHEAGAYYLQEPSAMAAPQVLTPNPGETVLDLCAAPGGKSIGLAFLMQNKGLLVANEIHPTRAKVLSQNIERMGITNCIVCSTSPEKLCDIFESAFDKILVDAPCSGEGMFRKLEEARTQWNEDSPMQCAIRQGKILESAAKMLKPGGKICYSTCTFNTVENEGVIDDFLHNHPDFNLEAFSLKGLPHAKHGIMRLLPHEIDGEGHFIALLKKRDGLEECSNSVHTHDNVEANKYEETRNCTDKCIEKFSHINDNYIKSSSTSDSIFTAPTYSNQKADKFIESICHAPKINGIFGNTYVSAPCSIDTFEGIKLLRFGLHIANDRGKYILPDHALALACVVKNRLEIDRETAIKYLSGETLNIDNSLKDWLSPTYKGYQLGWGKAVNGQLKNHYPKGLRKYLI
ncbi:MAG: SAM-dependent methyltransferase [Christensenellaceae bacterium]|nr:SAM-dependent methyltransferase [Christensenellaceae bacterium]